MSNLNSAKKASASKATTAVKLGFALAFAAIISSTSVSAKEVTFREMVDYQVAEQMQNLQSQLHLQLQQSFYAAVYAAINNDFILPGNRPVVNINDSEISEDEEE